MFIRKSEPFFDGQPFYLKGSELASSEPFDGKRIWLDLPSGIGPLIFIDGDANHFTGIGGIAGDGNAIYTISDSSDSHLDLSQSTESLRPTLQKNVLNGHSVIRFNDLGEYVTSDTISEVAPFTVFMLSKLVESDANRHYYTAGPYLIYHNETDATRLYYGATGWYAYDSLVQTYQLQYGVINGADSWWHVNGVTTEGTFGATNYQNFFGLGRSGYSSNMDIAFWAVYNSVLSDVDISSAVADITNRYAI